MKHTPGPWTITPPNGTTDDNVSHSICVPFCRLADVQEVGKPGESEANAQLISAAPDLLAALKTCADWLSRSVCVDDLEMAANARAAIARAEGGAA
jgi:hypothetical protein